MSWRIEDGATPFTRVKWRYLHGRKLPSIQYRKAWGDKGPTISKNKPIMLNGTRSSNFEITKIIKCVLNVQ